MVWSRLLTCSVMASIVSQLHPAFAQAPDWLARCRLQLADDSKPESGKYLFQTRGNVAGAEARAQLDYSSGLSARADVYPTEAKDFLNPYSNVSLSLIYFMPGNGTGKPLIGAMSFRSIGAGFNAIPGDPVTLKLLVDGVAFGPYEPKPVSSGMYSVWLDTADTDGDAKPPTLPPADFNKVAKAVDAAKSLEVVLVRNATDIARAAIPTPQLIAWRDGLSAWAARTNPGVGVATYCPGSEVLH